MEAPKLQFSLSCQDLTDVLSLCLKRIKTACLVTSLGNLLQVLRTRVIKLCFSLLVTWPPSFSFFLQPEDLEGQKKKSPLPTTIIYDDSPRNLHRNSTAQRADLMLLSFTSSSVEYVDIRCSFKISLREFQSISPTPA